MKNYSQNNEQKIIADYFGDHVGTFLDIGANDGETLSNTRALALKWWTGLCVDPSPSAFARLDKLYGESDRVTCLNVGVGTGNGKAILHESAEHLGVGDVALLSTANAGEMDRWPNEIFKPVEFECVTFAELLSRTWHAQFDFISIDAEGSDFDILAQMNLTALGCRMLIVEFNGKDEQKFTEYVRQFDMKLHAKNGENLIYVR